MTVFWWMVLSGFVMAKISLIGAALYFIPKNTWDKLAHPLVSFAAGSLLGGAFFHLLPESIDQLGNGPQVWLVLMCGIGFFLILEKFLHWHHCHKGCEHDVKAFGPLVIFADALHNFIDGMVVTTAFIADVRLGVSTLFVTITHELPQELGDYAVLVKSGYSRGKALFLNYLVSLTFFLGAFVVYFAANKIEVAYLLPFAAGNFIYIAASDLIPEIKPDDKLKNAFIKLGCFFTGVALLYFMSEH